MLSLLVIFPISIVVASFVGYWMHRLLHESWVKPFNKAHMQHHLELYPPNDLTSEDYRKASWYNRGTLLFTPLFLLMLIVTCLVTWFLGMSVWNVVAASVGFLAYGLLNDWLHDCFHLRDHFVNRLPWLSYARRMHFAHHVDMDKNYGIVSFEWDRIFKTKLDK
jgi:sterol desaturase/sphingolipid hydroxylase (fatty acid hydroxylase superfamily)